MKKKMICDALKGFKYIKGFSREENFDILIGILEEDFPEYIFQIDELNNGPAEINTGVIVVDVWANKGHNYTRFVLTESGNCTYHDKP